MIKFNEFLNKVNYKYDMSEFELRHGQVLMNILYKIWPEKYNEITGSDIDCFYDDGKVSKVLEKLQKDWNHNG